jgi:hypothetical protein
MCLWWLSKQWLDNMFVSVSLWCFVSVIVSLILSLIYMLLCHQFYIHVITNLCSISQVGLWRLPSRIGPGFMLSLETECVFTGELLRNRPKDHMWGIWLMVGTGIWKTTSQGLVISWILWCPALLTTWLWSWSARRIVKTVVVVDLLIWRSFCCYPYVLYVAYYHDNLFWLVLCFVFKF